MLFVDQQVPKKCPQRTGWVLCQTARGVCKGAAWVWKTGANLARNIITGRGVAICNDAYTKCLAQTILPF